MSAKEKKKELGLSAAKDLFIDWTSNTTFHGVNDVAKAETWWSRILWTLLVSFFALIMCIQVLDTFSSFGQHQWMTTMYEETSGDITVFPTVTVCSYNRLRNSEAERLNLTEDNMLYLFDKIPTQSGSIFNRTDVYVENNTASNDFVEWKRRNNMTTKQIFQQLGPLCADLIDFVSGDKFVNTDCTSTYNTNFTTVFTTEFGQCYQITFEIPTRILSAGKKQGVTLLLNAQLADYLSFLTNNYMDEGFALQVHYGPKVVMGQWLTVAPGFHYSMRMMEHQNRISMPGYLGNALQFLKLPFTSDPPCLLEPKLRYNEDRDYSREQCVLECSNDLFVQHCGCLLFVESPIVRMCEAEEVDPCHQYLAANNYSLVNDTCMALCTDPCTDRFLETSFTFSRFPTTAQLRDIRKLLNSIETGSNHDNLTIEQIRQEYALVDIFFDKLEIMVVERQELLGLENLISTCGGLMGLWAGISIITVFQAIAYLIYGFANVIAWPWKKTTQHIAPSLKAAMTLTLSTIRFHQEHQDNLHQSKAEELTKNHHLTVNNNVQRTPTFSIVEPE